MKEIKQLCEEILKGISVIEDTQGIVNDIIAIGVKHGSPSHEIGKSVSDGKDIVNQSVSVMHRNAVLLMGQVKRYKQIHDAMNNGKPQQYDTTTPVQDYEAGEMDAIRNNTRFEVTALVTPASNAA